MTRIPYLLTGLVSAWIAAVLTGGVAEARSLEDARRLVVYIQSDTPSGDEEFGAGVVFAVDSSFVYIVTADHVVRTRLDEHERLRVGFESWPGESLPAKLLDTRSTELDLAVLRVDHREAAITPNRLPDPAKVGRFIRSAELERGLPVFPIGHPEGHKWLVPGRSSTLQSIGGIEIEFDSACMTGHSGGGLFDKAWHLVGMMLKTDGSVCIAIDFETIIAELKKWRYEVDLQPEEQSSLAHLRPSVSFQPGAEIHIQLIDAVSTERDSTKTIIRGALGFDLVVNRRLSIPAGSLVTVRIVELQRPTRLGRKATMRLSLTGIEIDGAIHPISTSIVEFKLRASGGAAPGRSVTEQRLPEKHIELQPGHRIVFLLLGRIESPFE